jgi:large subunit ribosomal protein L10
VLSADEAKSLADLDSREVMLSKLAGLMKGEMSRAAATFQAAQSRFLSLLEAFKGKLPEEPAVQAASKAEATSPEPAPEAEANMTEEGPEDGPDDGKG